MDNGNNENPDGQKDQLRVDLLDRFDLYKTMSTVFFNRLNREEKIDALLEVIEVLKGGKGD